MRCSQFLRAALLLLLALPAACGGQNRSDSNWEPVALPATFLETLEAAQTVHAYVLGNYEAADEGTGVARIRFADGNWILAHHEIAPSDSLWARAFVALLAEPGTLQRALVPYRSLYVPHVGFRFAADTDTVDLVFQADMGVMWAHDAQGSEFFAYVPFGRDALRQFVGSTFAADTTIRYFFVELQPGARPARAWPRRLEGE